MFRLENKQQVLEQEAASRKLPVPKVLPSEKKKLNEKAKKMAQAYSWIVYRNKSISDTDMKDCSSFMQYKSKILANQKTDSCFYESLFVFSTRTLKDAFEEADYMKLEEEVNRLFRSNAFNITERNIKEKERLKMYPQLKEPTGPESDDKMLKRLQMRLRIPK